MQLVTTNTPLTMSSLKIAELTGKRHDHVLADIRKMLTDIHGEGGGRLAVEASHRNPQNGQTYPYFELTPTLAKLILDKYTGLARIPMRLQEESALKTIEQLLSVTLVRQFKVLKYRIDGYDPISNIAYEIDEPAHKHSVAHDRKRQQEIEDVLGCTFVRIKL